MKRLGFLLFCAPLLLGAAARNFDGTDDEIDFGNTLNITTGNVSVCAWWRGTEDASSDMIVVKRADNNAGTAGYALRQNSGDTVQIVVGDGTTSVGGGNIADADGVWLHACGTWDGSGNIAETFGNGVSAGTGTDTIGSLTTTSNLQMGEDNGNTNDANGDIAYGMVFSGSILTGVEVNDIMWLPDRSYAADVDGYWPLWGADPEQDLSGNARTGTIVAGAATIENGPPVMFGEGLPL